MARSPRRWRRRGLIGLGIVVALIAICLIIAPPIVGAVLPSRLERALAPSIDGSLDIEHTRLSWFGAQRLGPVVLRDDAGVQAASLTAKVDRGLFGLLTSWGRLGTITLAGDVVVIVKEDGTTNLEQIFKAGGAGAGGGAPQPDTPVRLPKRLKATLVVDDVHVTLIDPTLQAEFGPGVEAVQIGMNAKTSFSVGTDVIVDVDLDAACGPRDAPAAKDLGTLELNTVISNLTGADGVLHPLGASIQGSIVADDIPLAVADRTAHANGWIFDSFGASADATIGFDVSRYDADVNVSLNGEAISTDVQLTWHDGRLRLASPGTIRWRDSGLALRLRKLASRGTDDAVEFSSLPELTFALSDLDVGLDPDLPGVINIDGATLDVGIAISRIEASVVGLDGQRTPVHLAPRQMHITSADLASSLTINSHIAEGAHSPDEGKIETNLVLSGLADANGVPRLGPPESIEGTITMRDFPTAVFQTLVRTVDLSKAVGPTFDLIVSASSELESAASTIDVRLTSSNLGLDAAMYVDQQVIETRGDGVTATLDDASTVLSHLLADAPIDATSPGQISFSMPSLALDLKALSDGARLGAFTADATVSVTDSAGTLAGMPWTLAPITLQAGLDDATGLATLTIDNLTLDGADGGNVTIQLAADPGADWLPSQVTIDAKAPSVSSDMLALIPGLDAIDPQEDVGETIDLTLQVAADPSDLEQTLVGTMIARSRELTSRARVRLADGAIRAGGGGAGDAGVMLDLRHVGRLASKLLPADAPLDVNGGGWMRVQTDDLVIPMASWTPDIGAATGRIKLDGGNLGMRLTDMENRVVGAETIAIETVVGDSIVLDLIIQGEADQAAYSISGNITQAGSLAAFVADPADLQPEGAIKLEGFPTSLVAAFLPEGRTDAAFILLGASLNASLAATPSDQGIELDLSAHGAHASSRVQGRLESETLVISQATADASVPRGRARRLIQMLAPAADEFVRPNTALTAHVDVASWRLPLTDLAQAEPLEATATLDGTMNLRVNQAESAFETSEATLTASLPIGAMAGGDPEALKLTLNAQAKQEDHPLATLDAKLGTTIGGDNDAIQLTLDADDVDVAWFDSLLGEEGLLTGAFGPTATLTIGSESLADGSQFTVQLESLRVKTQQPAVISLTKDRIEIVKPFKAWWRVNPGWLAQRMSSERKLIALNSPATLKLTLDKLVLARGSGVFLPGVFDANAVIESDEIDVSFEDDVQATYTNLYIRVEDGDRPDELKLQATFDENGTQALTLKSVIDDVSDAQGHPSLERLSVSIDATAPNCRSDVLDALAAQKGKLKELLGPTVNLTVDADSFTKAGGTLKATANSSRTQLSLDGVIGYGAFVAAKPVELTVNEITPALAAHFLNGIPLGTIEKRPEDGPMTVVASGLQVPIDGDLSRLNGEVVIDVGVARFQTSSAFSRIVSLTQQRDSGTVGRRLGPLTVYMKDGVISYDRYTIPLGEFELETQARSIDLVNQHLNIITWIPIGALGDEAAGQFNSGLGSALGRALPTFDRLTRVPWRTRGSFSHPVTLPDVQLFVENTGAQLLRPDILIRDRLRGLFGNNKNAQDPPETKDGDKDADKDADKDK